MRNRHTPLLLVFALLLLEWCTLWREHAVNNWTDATGGEGLEVNFWKEVKAKNWSELERHMAGNYVATTQDGDRLDRAAVLEHLRQLQLDDYSMGDVQVEMNGNTLVVIYTVTLHGTIAQRPLPAEPIRMMSVWQQQKAGWMTIAHTTGSAVKQP
jgi:hypothetical protein